MSKNRNRFSRKPKNLKNAEYYFMKPLRFLLRYCWGWHVFKCSFNEARIYSCLDESLIWNVSITAPHGNNDNLEFGKQETMKLHICNGKSFSGDGIYSIHRNTEI